MIIRGTMTRARNSVSEVHETCPLTVQRKWKIMVLIISPSLSCVFSLVVCYIVSGCVFKLRVNVVSELFVMTCDF